MTAVAESPEESTTDEGLERLVVAGYAAGLTHKAGTAMSQYPTPNYRTPKQTAEHRAYMIRTILWLAAIPPLLFIAMVFGYSDQAPAFLRDLTAQLDGMFGRPVWSIISPAPK